MSTSPTRQINNHESVENPGYLLIKNGRTYQDPTSKLFHKPQKKYWPQYTFGVSADAPAEFHLKKTIINYSKVEHDLFLDYGIRDPNLPDKAYQAKHRPSMLKEYQTYNIKDENRKNKSHLPTVVSSSRKRNVNNIANESTLSNGTLNLIKNDSKNPNIITISPSPVQVYKYNDAIVFFIF